jgi:hypothetical protein
VLCRATPAMTSLLGKVWRCNATCLRKGKAHGVTLSGRMP